MPTETIYSTILGVLAAAIAKLWVDVKTLYKQNIKCEAKSASQAAEIKSLNAAVRQLKTQMKGGNAV